MSTPTAVVRDGVAYVVPGPDSPHHRLLTGRLPAGLVWHEPVPGRPLVGINRTEIEFLYREVWTDNAYLRHGLVLPDDAFVVDAGANIGAFTLFAAAHCRHPRIVAVEPGTEAAAALAANVTLYDVPAEIHRVALGAVPGEAEFTYYPGNTVMSGIHADVTEDRDVLAAYLTADPEADGVDTAGLVDGRMRPVVRTVPVTTLAELVGDHAVDLLKVDVEKAEWEVLAGLADGQWSRVAQVAVEVHDLGGRVADTVTLLRDKGFTVVAEQSPRLSGTPCHTVFARRPSARPASSLVPAEPTDLAARLAVRRVVYVRSLNEVPADGLDVRTAAARVLVEVWGGLFGPEAVRADADFFELGGSSLTAVRLIAAVEDRLGPDVLAPDTVFTTTRLGDLVRELEGDTA
jgi:FkbM family methyltransferase